MIDLSIIVVNWNTRELTLQCLESIDRETRSRRDDRRLETEVIVVDNGSNDGSEGALRARFPWVRLVTLARNLGFAAGCNAGLREATGRYVVLLNSDAQVLPDALEHCVRYLDEHPRAGIVGPQLLNPNGTRQNSFHNVPSVATELVPKSVFQFLLPRRFPSRRRALAEPLRVEAVAGAALFARAELVRGLGELSEDYFFFLEETDYCLRARQAGWEIVHLPQGRVLHLSGASSKRKNPALTRIEYHRSLYRFFGKFRGASSMRVVQAVKFGKALFYVVTQSPLALLGRRHRLRWTVHRDVLLWHLRRCPAAVGLSAMAVDGSVAHGPSASGRAVGHWRGHRSSADA